MTMSDAMSKTFQGNDQFGCRVAAVMGNDSSVIITGTGLDDDEDQPKVISLDAPTVKAFVAWASPPAADPRVAEAVLSSFLTKKLDDIVRQVAELPDRSSPEDWPEAMLVTADELRAILTAQAGDEGTGGR
jgi:hypothetical protein